MVGKEFAVWAVMLGRPQNCLTGSLRTTYVIRQRERGGQKKMIQRYNNLSLALGIPGIILQIGGNMYATVNRFTGFPVSLVGTGLLIAGLSFYAIAKGRSSWWGVCGFLSCVGLLILALLKDRAPTADGSKHHSFFPSSTNYRA